MATNSAVCRADAEFEQRSYEQQQIGKHLRMGNGKKDSLGSRFDPSGAIAFSPTDKVFKITEKERSSESHVQGITTKDWGRIAPADTFSTFLTEQRQEKEILKRDLEESLKKKPDQVKVKAELNPDRPKLGKEKNPFKRMCDDILLFDKEKQYVKDRSSGKLKCKEPEKEKRKERHHSFEKVKESGREKGSHYRQKASEKEKDQTKRNEKGLGIVDEKKAQQDRQKEKGGDGERKKGSDENEKGKAKKIGMVGIKSGDVSGNSTAENSKNHREKVESVAETEERRKRKSIDKDEERGKGVEKDAKKYSKERGCSTETKERVKHHSRKTAEEEKVKGRDRDFKDKEKRKKQTSDWFKEHSTGKSGNEIKEVFSCEDGDFSGVKTKNFSKDKHAGDTNNSLSYDTVQKTDQGNSTSLALSSLSEVIHFFLCILIYRPLIGNSG